MLSGFEIFKIIIKTLQKRSVFLFFSGADGGS